MLDFSIVNTWSVEKRIQFLQRAGILNEDGELHERFQKSVADRNNLVHNMNYIEKVLSNK